jgi:hypothetical protein
MQSWFNPLTIVRLSWNIDAVVDIDNAIIYLEMRKKNRFVSKNINKMTYIECAFYLKCAALCTQE